MTSANTFRCKKNISMFYTIIDFNVITIFNLFVSMTMFVEVSRKSKRIFTWEAVSCTEFYPGKKNLHLTRTLSDFHDMIWKAGASCS